MMVVVVNYRGLVKIAKKAINSKSHVECDTILLMIPLQADTILLIL